jgi:predicted PurR-regulated permease PerM
VQTDRSQDLTRTVFQVLSLGVLIAASFWIVRPFLIALTWAAMIVVATWPLLLLVQARLGGRRSLAVAVMTGALLLVLVVPFYFGIAAIVENAPEIVEWSRGLATLGAAQPPEWIESIPLIGSRLVARWQEFTVAGPDELAERLAPLAQRLVGWLVGQVGSAGRLLVELLLTAIIAAVLYAKGETAARGGARFARRLAGPQGEGAVHLAGQAIRGVALGVVVTALLQSTLSGIGVALAGVPFATLLTALMFMLCVAQLGPALVLIPAVIWVYWRSGASWGTGFLVWAIFCGTLDNFVRPILIKRGADLPLLLIFTGVIGGLIAFGIIGLFIGPVVLAVAYTLLVEWVSQDEASADVRSSASPPA